MPQNVVEHVILQQEHVLAPEQIVLKGVKHAQVLQLVEIAKHLAATVNQQMVHAGVQPQLPLYVATTDVDVPAQEIT